MVKGCGHWWSKGCGHWWSRRCGHWWFKRTHCSQLYCRGALVIVPLISTLYLSSLLCHQCGCQGGQDESPSLELHVECVATL